MRLTPSGVRIPLPAPQICIESKSSMSVKFHRRRVVIISASVLFLIILYYLLGGLLISNVASTRLKSVFNQQSAIFAQPIASLGIAGSPSATFQCNDYQNTHLESYILCQDSYSYPYNPNPISTSAKNSYVSNATKFDALLKQNGWVNDRPHDAITTLVASDPYLPQNGGNGGDVPFHKNIGSISCNLEIDFEGLWFPDNPIPGSISVNEFSCQQTVKVFMPHISNWQSGD